MILGDTNVDPMILFFFPYASLKSVQVLDQDGHS
jgi:hypothetical protein